MRKLFSVVLVTLALMLDVGRARAVSGIVFRTNCTTVPSPFTGMLCQNTLTQVLYTYNGTTWVSIASSSGGSSGVPVWTGPTLLTGSDTIDYTTSQYRILTLPASTTTSNENLLITDTASASITGRLPVQTILCQNTSGSGGVTITFTNTNIHWNDGVPPGIAMAPGWCTFINLDYNGTNFIEDHGVNFQGP